MVWARTLGVLVLVLVAASVLVVPGESILVYASSPQQGSLENTLSAKDYNRLVYVAKMLVEKVRDRITSILGLTEKYNITIQDNMTSILDRVKSLLANASRIVNDEPRQAIRLALEAMREFKPIALYVIKSIPSDERRELVENRLEQAIARRETLLKSIEERLEWLSNRNISVPESLWKKTDEAKQLLAQARELIQSDNYSVSQIYGILHRADMLVTSILRELYGYTHRAWCRIVFIEHSYHRFIKSLVVLTRGINVSIDLVEKGEVDRALAVIDRLTNATSKLVDYTSKLIGISENKSLENVTSLLERIRDVLVSVENHLVKAKDYLSANETMLALDELSNAVSTLTTLLEENRGIFKDIAVHLRMLAKLSERIHRMIGKMLGKIIAEKALDLLVFINRIEHRLHMLKKMYEEEKVSVDEYKSSLQHIKQLLENIKDKLENIPKTPQRILEKISKLINWINEQLSSLPTSQQST